MSQATIFSPGPAMQAAVPLTKPELHYDVVVIGAGPAGLAAAVGARAAGAKRVLVLDRKPYAGGMLPQCVHDGFGRHIFSKPLTGPEYAKHWEDRACEAGARIALGTMVLDVQPTVVAGVAFFLLEVMGDPLGGHSIILARSVIAATGCHERTDGLPDDAGKRPYGVMTAGTAQYMTNVLNEMPGDKVVVLGSDNIGLIMARRLALQGADVRMVLGQRSTGLLRNHVRCIEDFSIPFREGWGCVSVHGEKRLDGVKIAPMLNDATCDGSCDGAHDGARGACGDAAFDLSRSEYIRCNLLLIANGLEPAREVLGKAIGSEGLFLCGDASTPHDLVDQITQEGLQTGIQAAIHSGVPAGDVLSRIKGIGLDRMILQKIAVPKGHAPKLIEAPWGAKRVPCTLCPARCVMSVGADGHVVGHACQRGADYAIAEANSPMRTFTGTVRLDGDPRRRLLPVRTDCEIPREMLRSVAELCRTLTAHTPICAGEVVCSNIGGTSADLVATKTVSQRRA